MRLPSLRRRRRGRGESGVAAVEMAICLPIIGVLFTGIADYGLAYNSARQIGTVVTAASRQGAAAAAERLADYAVLRAVNGSLGSDTALTRVIVFKADATSAIPIACYTSSVSGICNSYTPAQVRTLTAANFTHTAAHC